MKSGKPAHTPAVRSGDTTLYQQIRELVVTARQTAALGVDLVQVHTNFEIGRHIVEHEQQGETRADYGKEVIKNLAERLTSELGQGFSLSNLKLMRQFFLQFQERAEQIGQTASGQLSDQAGTAKASPFQIVQSWSEKHLPHCLRLAETIPDEAILSAPRARIHPWAAIGGEVSCG